MRNVIQTTAMIVAGALVALPACKNPPDKADRSASADEERKERAQAEEEETPGTAESVNIPAKRKPIPSPEDVSAPPEDAERTDSGLASKVLEEGSGTEHPGPEDSVTVHYTGWTTDGRMFDSSVVRGKPVSFSLDGVIKGWTEGLQLMVEGEKRRLWIPEELAYKGKPGRPQGMLVFDVELIDVITPPPVPEDVSAPPEDAERTDSGLASKVLEEGSGTEHPEPSDRVKVHYTGWTTNGEMFDSSVLKGRPATFPLDRVIAGWTEGLQLMVEGEKRRFWIPEELAYKGKPGRPQGMLVFDVELIEIQ
jgi:peptidylprolyl isomerase